MYPKPASISIFHRIRCLSVCQSISFFANDLSCVQNGPYRNFPSVQVEPYHDLPSVQDEPYHGLPSAQDESYHGLPSAQDEFYHGLPSVQDESYHSLPSAQDEHNPPRYRPLVVFSQKIDNRHGGTHVQSHQVLPADLACFSQHPLKQFPCIFSQHVSRCSLLCKHYLVPFLHLLVHFFSNIYTVLIHAHISPGNHLHTAILVRIETMRFFLRPHDFAALQRKTGQRLLRIPYSILYNFSCSRFSYYSRT